MLFLCKNKEIIAYTTGFTKYENCYTTVNQAMDIKLITYLLIKDDVFKPQLGCGTKNTKFIDLFYIETTKIVSNKPINKYL